MSFGTAAASYLTVSNLPPSLAAYSCNGSGTTLTDHSGNGHTGTLSGDVVFDANGKHGGALYNGDYPDNGSGVSIPRSGLEPTNGLTIMAWVKNTVAIHDYRAAIAKSRSGQSDSYSIYTGYDTPGVPHFDISTTTGTETTAYGGPIMQDLEWHHLCGTWDGAMMRLYVDGAEVDSKSHGGTLVYTTSDVWLMGSHDWNEPMDGLIDDVRIYGQALDASQVIEAMNNPV